MFCFSGVLAVFILVSCVEGIFRVDEEPLRKYDAKDAAETNEVLTTADKLLLGKAVKVDGRILIPARDQLHEVILKEGSPTQLQEVIRWEALDDRKDTCRKRGKSAELCHNFITVVLQKEGNLYTVCGTNAYSPMCRDYKFQSGKFSPHRAPYIGTNISPYAPTHSVAAHYEDGCVYSATMSDLLGNKPIMNRHSFVVDKKNLETPKSNSLWLNEPTFVDFLGANSQKVYSLFREQAVEDNSGLTYSRVAQLCKSDIGGEYVLKNKFTSYQKARLLCRVPGKTHFYFNELQDASDFIDLKEKGKVTFTIMTTPANSIPGSAICAYSLDDIEAVLIGRVMDERTSQSDNVKYWAQDSIDESLENYIRTCEVSDEDGPRKLKDAELNFIGNHPMKAEGVESWDGLNTDQEPIFMKTQSSYTFTALATDADIQPDDEFVVLFVGTSEGHILKVAAVMKEGAYFTPTEQTTPFIEERLVFDEDKCGSTNREVKSIIIDRENGILLVNFESCAIVTPLCPLLGKNCEKSCMEARDPYCTWSAGSCITITERSNKNKDEPLGTFEDCPILIEDVEVNSTPNKVVNSSENFLVISNKTTTVSVPINFNSQTEAIKSAGSSIPILLFVIVMLLSIFFTIIFTLGFVCYCFNKSRKFRGKFKYPKHMKQNNNSNGSVMREKQSVSSHGNNRSSQIKSDSMSSRKRTTSEKSCNSRNEVFDENAPLQPKEPSHDRSRTTSDAKRLPRQSSSASHKNRTSKQSASSVEDHPPDGYKRSFSHESSHSDKPLTPENAPMMAMEGERLNQSMPNQSKHRSDDGLMNQMSMDDQNGTMGQRPRNQAKRNLSVNLGGTYNPYQAHIDTPMPKFQQRHPLQGRSGPPMHASNSFPYMNNTQSLDRRPDRNRKNNMAPNLANVTEEEPVGNHYNSQPRKRYQSESATAGHMIRNPNMMTKQPSIDEEEPPVDPRPLSSPAKSTMRDGLNLDLQSVYSNHNQPYMNPGAVTGPAALSSTPNRRGNNPTTPIVDPYMRQPYTQNTLPGRQLNRQHSEMIPGGYNYHPRAQYPYHTINPKPQLISQHSMYEQGHRPPVRNGRPPMHQKPRSNPGTPDDPNMTILSKHPSNERMRNPSGRSQGVPSSPSKHAAPPLVETKQDSRDKDDLRSRHISGQSLPNGGDNGTTRRSSGISGNKPPLSVAPSNGAVTSGGDDNHTTL